MIGIHFVSNASFSRILSAILSPNLLGQFNWFISEYMTLSDDNEMEIGTYSSNQLHSLICQSKDVGVDYMCMFATTQMGIVRTDLPLTVQDYLDSKFVAIFVCTDSVEFDLYCKNTDIINAFRDNIVAAKICIANEIEIISIEADDRTGFSW